MLREASDGYIQHWCQIPVPDPGSHSQYIVSVRPKEEEKFIKSSNNSEFGPQPSVAGAGGQGFVWRTVLFHGVIHIKSGSHSHMARSSCLSL